MFCSACGQQNADEASFCSKCGKQITSLTPAQQPPPGAAPANVYIGMKESGIVTAMSVVGLVFGLIGMNGSFIPCIGSLAFYIGIPAALISAIALFIAYSQNSKKTFAVVALTISLIGVVISGWQYHSIVSLGNSLERELKQMNNIPQIPNKQSAPKVGSNLQSKDQTNSFSVSPLSIKLSDNKTLKVTLKLTSQSVELTSHILRNEAAVKKVVSATLSKMTSAQLSVFGEKDNLRYKLAEAVGQAIGLQDGVEVAFTEFEIQ
jgi:flagellar basal body-associated protein FliL